MIQIVMYDAPLQRLMEYADCIDKGVIIDMIDVGLNHTNSYEGAVAVGKLSGFMLWDHNGVLSDTRAAFAVRTGLIEMCLNLIDENFGLKDTSKLFRHIEDVLITFYDLLLHQKTAKAFRYRRSKIEEKLGHLELDAELATHDKCKRILEIVRLILINNGAYCCWCNMSLGRTEVKECNGCSRMTYCSKECQKKDWLNGGHNLTCNKDPAEVSMYHFQGRIRPVPKTERDATKLKALEINMTMIQQKLFLENAETILSLASSLNLQLCDCVVEFDLRDCPATIKTMHYGAYFDSQN